MRLVVVVLAAVSVASACTPEGRQDPLEDFSGDPIPMVGDDAFLGEIVEVVHFDAPAWMTGPDGPMVEGGSHSDFQAGPAEFILTDGTHLVIPPGIPAGNTCVLLNPYEAGLEPVDAVLHDAPCTIAGVFAPNGTVKWFKVTDNATRSNGRLVYQRHLIGFQGQTRAVVSDRHERFAFEIDDDAEWRNCDVSTAMPSTPGIYASSQSIPGASIDAETLTVTTVDCNSAPIEHNQ